MWTTDPEFKSTLKFFVHIYWIKFQKVMFFSNKYDKLHNGFFLPAWLVYLMCNILYFIIKSFSDEFSKIFKARCATLNIC